MLLYRQQRSTEVKSKMWSALSQLNKNFKVLMLILFFMHHPGDTESLLHGSRARPCWACGRVGGRLGRQARFWEAATRDDLVIALSGFVSVKRAYSGVQTGVDFCWNFISKPPLSVESWKFESRHHARASKSDVNVAAAIESVKIQQATSLQTAGQWMSDPPLARCFGKRQISLSEINAWQRTSLARNK